MTRSKLSAVCILSLATILAFGACTKTSDNGTAGTEDQTSAQGTADTAAGLANPASTYCAENGGITTISTDATGAQSGQCQTADGRSCEEWEYFRSSGQTCVPATASDISTLIDPCELLTPVNGEALVGTGAQQNTYGGAHRCEYENPTTYATVSVGVDTYDPTLTLYGEEVSDTSADRALWASSSNQLILIEGASIFTIIVIPASGDALTFARQAAVMVLANYAAMD